MEELRIGIEVTCVEDEELDCINLCMEALSKIKDVNVKVRIIWYLKSRYGNFVAHQNKD